MIGVSKMAFTIPESKEVSFNCPIHGEVKYTTFATSSGEFKPAYCPACQADLDAEAEIIEQIRDESRTQALAIKSILNISTPPAYKACTFDSFEVESDKQTKVLNDIRKFADNFMKREIKRHKARAELMAGWDQINRWGLYLQGDPGTGKTHLSYAILNSLENQGIGVVYLKVFDLFQVLRNFDLKMDEAKLFRLLAVVPCLILDEFGRQSWSEFERNRMWKLIDDRITHGRPMVIITNASKSEITAAVDASVLDRFKDSLIPEVFDWQSRRGKARPNADEVF